MTEKRFTTNGYYIYDHFKGDKWLVNEVEVEYIVTLMNNLDTKARERSKALSKLQKENEQLKKDKTNLHRAMSKERVNYFKFRDKVFDIIDKKIKEVDTIGAEVLKDLRKELKE